MQIIRPHDFSAQVADALAELRLWVLQVIAWIAEFAPLPREARLWLQRQLRHVRSDLRVMLAAAIISKMRLRERPRRFMHKRTVQRGFGWTERYGSAIRFFTRGIRLRTLRDIRRVLDHFDAIVERAFARLPRARRGGMPLITHTPKAVAAPFAIAPATEAADTS